MTKPRRCAILIGGGPAPGINSVIRAATIKLRNEAVSVVGIYDGFKHLINKDISQIRELFIPDVSTIHFDGGSILRTSRDNPTKNTENLQNVLESLELLNVEALMTIGGDDTCFSAVKLQEMSEGKIQFVHVPKTIDNDLDLPYGIRTFGFATARHVGCDITKNIITDAMTTQRWYIITAMGRKAGHLALGVGRSSGATLTIIPEEFPGKTVQLRHIVDILVGAVIKRITSGRPYGVAIMAEGLIEKLSPDELHKMGHVELDQYGHIRMSEINFGGMIKDELKKALKEFNISTTVVDKDIGYELRSVGPIPFDIEYTQDLGYSSAVYLLEGKSGDMASIQDGRFVPIPFKTVIDPKTGRTKIRMVNIETESYKVALEYMIRLKKEDFTNEENLNKLAKSANITSEQFKKRFSYLVSVCP